MLPLIIFHFSCLDFLLRQIFLVYIKAMITPCTKDKSTCFQELELGGVKFCRLIRLGMKT